VVRVALVLAFAAMAAAGLPAPGLYFAIGCGIGAIGCGWLGYTRKTAPGASRLVAAAAMTIGMLGMALGAVRVAIVLLAIGRIDRMLG
jgi:hypothetical protein